MPHPAASATSVVGVQPGSTVDRVFDTVSELTGEGSALSTLNGRLIRVNDRLCEILGQSRDELLRRSWMEVIAAGRTGSDTEVFRRVVSGETGSACFSFRVRWPGGSIRDVRVSVVSLRSAESEGAPDFLLGLFEDVTKQAEVAEALLVSEDRLALALEASGHGLWDWDMQSNRLYFSPQYCSMLGYDPAALRPSLGTWRDLVHPEDLPAAESHLRKHLEHAEHPYHADYRMRAKDGQWRWIHSRGRVVAWDGTGRPQRMVGTHVDMTAQRLADEERLRLERQIQQAQKLESLGVMASGIAHDFNNLLAAILGSADLALLDLPEDSSAHALIQEISKAGRRAADLCRQMLAYSGKGGFTVHPLDLTRTVEDLSKMIEASISKKVTLEYALGKGLPPIQAEAAQLQQVILNLVTNASEAHGDQSGRVTIATGVANLDRRYLNSCQVGSSTLPGRHVFLEVSDTGCGMDAETQRRMFEPFFTTKFLGRGLGLSAVVGIVSGHQGVVRVQSSPGQGTQVRVLFPAMEPLPSAVPVEPPRAGEWRGQGLVLLAEDEPAVRTLCQRMLERLGFTVVAAPDGKQALELCDAHEGGFACVVLDLTMPVMSGEETLRELHRRYPALPVLLSSGYPEEQVREQLRELPVRGVIQKPFEFDTLRKQVQNAVASPAGS